MVITGGEFRPDSLKPKEVVSLLLDDEEMEARCKYHVPLIKMTESSGKTTCMKRNHKQIKHIAIAIAL